MGDRLQGKIALVTGAGSGIGQAVALRFAQERADVIVTSRSPAHVEETCSLIAGATGRRPLGIPLDVRSQTSIEAAMRIILDRYGHIEVLSNNAGVDETSEPTVAEMSDTVWDTTMLVNVTGIFKVCRAAIPVIADGGAIINMASRDALIARRNAAAYCASKAALLQLTRSIALELAERRIRANCVCPGVVDTPLVDQFLARSDNPAELRAEYARSNAFGRLADVSEISSCVLFLASDESSFVTGSALVADGGALSW